MKAILLTIILAVILLSSILPLYVSAQAVEPAEGLGRYNESGGIVPRCNTASGPDGRFTDPCTPCHIFRLLENILNFLWWGVSIPVVTLFILYGGVLMIVPFGGEKSASMHTKGKKVITNALVGLGIVFFSWVFVDTIIKAVGGQRIGASETGQVRVSGETFGPWNVINCNITPAPASAPQPPFGQNPITREVQTQLCPSCVNLAVPARPATTCTASSRGQTCVVNNTLNERLVALNRSINRPDYWWVTEAWPPTRPHNDACHQNGTCVDGNFRGNYAGNPTEIRNFITQADRAGLRVEYEVGSTARRDELIRAGVPPENIRALTQPGQITGEHFSIYMR